MTAPHKLFYKGSNVDDFVVFIDDATLRDKYVNGDTTIPLIDIVSIYKVFVNRQGGLEGVLDEASKNELSNEFGTTDIDAIIKRILKEGSDKHNPTVLRGGASKNDSYGAGATGN